MQEAIVIGGGVVGLTSAWWLLEAGFRRDLARTRSHRPGRQLPQRRPAQLPLRLSLADAGVPLKAIQWLFDENGPLRFKPEFDLRQWKWLASFLANCNAADNARTTAKLLELGELSRRAMAELDGLRARPTNLPGAMPARWWCTARKGAFAAAVAKPDSESSRQVLSPEECVAKEPALASAQSLLAGGIFNEGEAVADCYAFCELLAARLHRPSPLSGRAAHRSAPADPGRQRRHHGPGHQRGVLQADHYVLAAGIDSRDLAAGAGIYLPLYL